tara:strand:+ start:13816 stop:14538 length:723 start_codon:yes stop_codon:yes gene_type:complete
MYFKIIGHRGDMNLAPENSLSSLNMLKINKINWIEIDTILAKDNIPVIFHDKELNRVSNFKGEVINYNFDELKKADIGSKFSNKFKNEKIPSLSEFILISNSLSINIFLELKSYYDNKNDFKLVKEVAKRLNNINLNISIILCSYSKNIIKYLKKCIPNFKRSLIVDYFSESNLEFSLANECYSININYKPNNNIEDIKKLKEKINVYCHVINKKEDIEELKELGINGIITDNPIEISKN